MYTYTRRSPQVGIYWISTAAHPFFLSPARQTHNLSSAFLIMLSARRVLPAAYLVLPSHAHLTNAFTPASPEPSGQWQS